MWERGEVCEREECVGGMRVCVGGVVGGEVCEREGRQQRGPHWNITSCASCNGSHVAVKMVHTRTDTRRYTHPKRN